MKLAEDQGEGKLLREWCKASIESENESTVFSWNLSHDYDYEHFPKEVARCLRDA